MNIGPVTNQSNNQIAIPALYTPQLRTMTGLASEPANLEMGPPHAATIR